MRSTITTQVSLIFHRAYGCARGVKCSNQLCFCCGQSVIVFVSVVGLIFFGMGVDQVVGQQTRHKDAVKFVSDFFQSFQQKELQIALRFKQEDNTFASSGFEFKMWTYGPSKARVSRNYQIGDKSRSARQKEFLLKPDGIML